MLSDDSVYARRPWSSMREQQVSDLLSEWTAMPTDAIRALAPPVPNIGRTPPRFGYRQHVLRVEDIVRIDDLYPGARVDYSQRQSGFHSAQMTAPGVT